MHYKEVKGILSARNGMNVFRGCTHGCIYCDSRSRCYQINHNFEDVEVKINAPELLEAALRKKRGKCMIGTGAMCDPYIPEEAQLNHTRKCFEIIERYGFGLAVQTKSDLILRDTDLLLSINQKAKCAVQMTLTTYDEDLCKIIEPNVCTTKRRFEVLKILNEAGIKTVVWLSPFLPYINDTRENIEGLLDYIVRAKVYGIITFGIGLTLRDGNREYYYENLNRHFPQLTEKYIRKYGNMYEIKSDNEGELSGLIIDICKKHGILYDRAAVFNFLGEFPHTPEPEQLSLWG
ncbi:MAG: radical SAM protein [Clostridiales bacterium]|jgi:DNA repair photolyase|nr:radical SAM protein [Clostridiales bacterium]